MSRVSLKKNKILNGIKEQSEKLKINFRHLTNSEISELKDNHNRAENWEDIFVSSTFDSHLIKNSEFYGSVYLCGFENKQVNYLSINFNTGIYNSTISNAIIGANAALKNVHYLHNYHIDDDAILFNVAEITCNDNATFGNGYKSSQSDRIYINIANENGGRKILPFERILPADAFLYSRFREDKKLLAKLINFTDDLAEAIGDTFGVLGKNSIVKNTHKIENCKIGPSVVIDGANQLRNLTIESSKKEPSYIGDSSELINGIIGFSNKIDHGSKCINFVTGRKVTIELGARVIHTLVGANSTIACCEVLNNLIFPFHEQHHNNSFLIASTIAGQSNIAAGATIGSNHNSRSADGEIYAERGFWPGLNSSFKHNSFFAPFTLVAKDSYDTELNIRLPFSLLSKDKSGNLQVMPAFWFRYNMYALARNSWKFVQRDKRIIKEQNIEMDFLAPDTAMYMLNGIKIIEQAIENAKQSLEVIDEKDFNNKNDLNDIYLMDAAPKEKVLIIKPIQAIRLYRAMISYFAAKEILGFCQSHGYDQILSIFNIDFAPANWMNFGGQLICENDYQTLIQDIKNNKLKSWDSLHNRYNELWENYNVRRRDSAIQSWLEKEDKSSKDISTKEIIDLLIFSVEIDKQLLLWTKEARLKDYQNPFRKNTYRNSDEMNAVLGEFAEDSFIKESDKLQVKYKNDVRIAVSQIKNI